MRKLGSALLSFAILVSLCPQALAWGGDGHRTVGEVATLYLAADKDTATLDWVKQVLKGQTLAQAATWPDDIKSSKTTPKDPDTQLFLAKVKNHNAWHYVDLPVGCTDFDTCDKHFKPEPEIVDRINASIKALLGSPGPKDPLNKRNAMRVLAHLLGDIHQPLHVGVEYVRWGGGGLAFNTDVSQILKDKAHNDPTIGGNTLMVGPGDSLGLHSYWDGTLVAAAMRADGTKSVPVFASHLRDKFKNPTDWGNSGPITGWAADWATEALKLSEEHVYPTVELVKRRKGDPFHKGQLMWVYDIKLGDSYEEDNTPFVRDQLAKAGYRLAKLLQAIHAQAGQELAPTASPSGGNGGARPRRPRARTRRPARRHGRH